MYFRQEHPTATRAIAAAVVAVVVLAVIGGIVLLTTGGSGSTAGGSTQRKAAEADSSACGLPAGSQDVPSSGPSAEWDTIGAYSAPRSRAYGPGAVDDQIRSCFAHSPSGALFAAANRTANSVAPSLDQAEFVEKRFARGPLFGQYLQLARDGQLDPSTNADAQAVESAPIAGFQFKSYSRQAAQIDIVYRGTLTSGASALIAESVHLVWEDGDWKSYLDSLDAPVTNPESLAGYTAWQPTADTSGGAGGSSAPALGRAAPSLDGSAQEAALVTPRAAAAAPTACIACKIGSGIKQAAGGPANLLAGGASDAAGSVVGSVASSGFEKVAQFFVDAMNYTLKNFLTAWMKLPDPNITSGNSLTTWLTARTSAIVAFLMVGSVLVSAARIAITGQWDGLRQLGGAIVRTVLTGGLITVVLPTALQVGDAYADWILGQAKPDLVTKGIAFSGFNPALLLIFGLFVMLLQLFQLVIMIFRNLAVMYLAVTVTLFAAGSTSRAGKGGFDRQIAWLIALVFYKPAAAFVYAGVFKLFSNKDLLSQMYGVVGMIVALVALPAMMRLLAPVTSAVGGANAGALAGATVGAGIATGAMVMSGGATGGAGLAGLSKGGGSAGGAGAPAPGGGDSKLALGAPSTPPALEVGGGQSTAPRGPVGASPAPGEGDTGGLGASQASSGTGGGEGRSFGSAADAAGRGASAAGGVSRHASGAIDDDGNED